MSNPTGKGGFQPGRSGNPGGRSKALGEYSEKAREHSDEALDLLVTIMKDAKAPLRERRAAAEHLLDRGLGKPQQSIDMNHGKKDPLDEILEAVNGTTRGITEKPVQ